MNEGQPVPDSNLSFEENRGRSQPAHLYVPYLWLFQYLPVNAISVPLRRSNRYASGSRVDFHSLSVLMSFSTGVTGSQGSGVALKV